MLDALETIGLNIAIKSNQFYLNDFLKPFVQIYINHSRLAKKCQFKLFHQYIFGNWKIENFNKNNLNQDSKIKALRNSETFIGFRKFKRKYCPFFISLYYSDKDDILYTTGFSTMIPGDNIDNKYFSKYIDIGCCPTKPVKVQTEYSGLNQNDTLAYQLKKIVDSMKD